MKPTRRNLLRIILLPFLLHWGWLFYHYLSTMWQMIDLGWHIWNMGEQVPTVYLVVQSWMLFSEFMVMAILVLLALTFKDD